MDICPKKKCGEYNMLKCCLEAGHSGACCFVVDHHHDYKLPIKSKPPSKNNG